MKTQVYTLLIIALIILSCGSKSKPDPRPRGFFRVDFPEKSYDSFPENMPFNFEIPSYSMVQEAHSKEGAHQFNLFFPWYNATLHCSYIKDTNLIAHTKFSKDIAYKQQVFASAIDEVRISNSTNSANGILYDIKGNVGGNVQFYLLDSTDQFFRGSFVFNVSPNYDSVRPVLDYLRKDFDHLINTFEWADKE